MQEKDDHEQWVQQLSSLMSYSYVSVHRHIADRLAALLSLEEVVWVDGDLKEGNFNVSGVLAVFTDSVVAIVELTDELRGQDSLSGRPLGTTDVLVLPRRALARVSLPGGSPADRVNDAYTWSRFTPDGRRNNEGWPSSSSAPVDLHFGDSVVRVNGAVGSGREGFSAFMASIMRDLASC